jgi:hypothetical protein
MVEQRGLIAETLMMCLSALRPRGQSVPKEHANDKTRDVGQAATMAGGG